MKEKLLIDAKKEKEAVEKQLAEAKKEVKNVSTRFLAVSEEKSRMTYIIDEKVQYKFYISIINLPSQNACIDK